MTLPKEIKKRDGRVVDFNAERIQNALKLCFRDIDKKGDIKGLTDDALKIISRKYHDRPTVEQIQDVVEDVLLLADELDAAKHYIIYRYEHEKQREVEVPQNIKEMFDNSAKLFPTPLRQFQFFDKYSRWNDAEGHRETWNQTVERGVDFLDELTRFRGDIGTELEQIRKAVLNMEAMPSMRLLATAGPAARRNNISIYNCSYLPIDSIYSWIEGLIISMSGCGVGYSVERKNIDKLPKVVVQSGKHLGKVVVEDSSEGWANALCAGLNAWFEGTDVDFDLSEIRPAGAVLKIKGGRASGPGPLRWLLNFLKSKILARQGSFIRPVDAHDMMCAVGEAAVSGGHRRTAMICLFDPDDDEVRLCKSGENLAGNEFRWNANNSMVLDTNIGQKDFAHWFMDMVDSERGEPGIFSREVARMTMPARRDTGYEFGTNPCAEIYLRPYEFCNLSIAVARKDDTLKTLSKKVETATLIGTLQSLATHFPMLNEQWKKNSEEERLLGVSIAGQMDSPAARDPHVQRKLKELAIHTNQKFAQKLGINPSAAITCVKPDGNSGVLLDASSGIHARWSPYQIRNVQVQADTPIFKVLKDSNVPIEARYSPTGETTAYVASFPLKAPEGAIIRGQQSAIEQCEYWLQVKQNWTEHNPSFTCYYEHNEVLELMKWVYGHRNWLGGVSFLPNSDVKFEQMPNIEITKDEYEVLYAKFPEIDWSRLYIYESEDYTTAAQQLACVGGACEIGE